MKTIITYGTFDLFHVGHIRLLKRLRALGDRLVVGLSTDEFNEKKGKKCVISYADRAEILAGCKFVDHVFPENCWEQKEEDIRREQADIFAMGDDWAGKFDFLNNCCQVIYLPRTDGISTTDIKNVLTSRITDELIALRNVIKHADQLTDVLLRKVPAASGQASG